MKTYIIFMVFPATRHPTGMLGQLCQPGNSPNLHQRKIFTETLIKLNGEVLL